MTKTHQIKISLTKSPLLIAKASLFICLLATFSAQAQIQIGFKKVNIFANISLSSPEKELENYYSDGDLLKFYVGAEVPFVAANYSKKSAMGFSVAALLDHETANFTSGNYSTDGLDAKMTSIGVRVRPFDISELSEYTRTVDSPDWSEDEEANFFIAMVLSGLYFDYGKTNMSFIEPPLPNKSRTATMYSYGLSPGFTVNKITWYMDIGIRHYKWTNSLNTTSGIKAWHIGFGVGFNIK